MFLSAGGADVFMNLKKNKEKQKQKRSVWVKDWIRKCCTKHVRRESNKQTGKGVIMNTTPDPDPDRPTMRGRVGQCEWCPGATRARPGMHRMRTPQWLRLKTTTKRSRAQLDCFHSPPFLAAYVLYVFLFIVNL